MAERRKLTKKALISGDFKTKSKIPKTAREKTNYKRAEGIAAKESGKYSEKNLPYGLVDKIYKNAEKAGKTIKKGDAKKAKYSKTVAKYKNKK